ISMNAEVTSDSAPLEMLLRPGRTLVQWTLALNYSLGGANVVGYHVINWAIHISAGLVFFGIMRRLLDLQAPGGRWHDEAAPLALVAAVLFVVHPLQTESVTYIVQRFEAAMAFFYLLAIYCLIRGAAPDCRRWGGCLWYAGSVVACGLGMKCKEVM